MKKYLLIVFTVFICATTIAQKNGDVKGVIFDTIAKQPVTGATITLLDKKDSSLVSFTMTNGAGVFTLNNISYGDYRLLVTHVSYHNVNKNFSISDSARNIDLGNIEVSDKNKVLEEVVLMADDCFYDNQFTVIEDYEGDADEVLV